MAVNIETQRFEKMCEAFYKIAEMAMDSDSKCEKVVEWTGKLKNFFDDHTSSDAAQPYLILWLFEVKVVPQPIEKYPELRKPSQRKKEVKRKKLRKQGRYEI